MDAKILWECRCHKADNSAQYVHLVVRLTQKTGIYLPGRIGFGWVSISLSHKSFSRVNSVDIQNPLKKKYGFSISFTMNFFAKAVAAAGLLLLQPAAGALEATLADASISFQDEATRIGGLRTLFVDDATLVTLDGIAYSEPTNSTNIIWQTLVDDVVQSEGSFSAEDQPSSIDAGTIVVEKCE